MYMKYSYSGFKMTLSFSQYQLSRIRRCLPKYITLQKTYYAKSEKSKGRPPTPQQQILEKLVETDKKHYTQTAWKKYESEILSCGKFINQINLDSNILNYCVKSKRLDLALSYRDYVKNSGRKMSVTAIAKVLQLYGRTYPDAIPRHLESHVFEIYSELQKATKVLDISLSENVIQALSLTSRWKDCEKILEDVSISGAATAAAYSYFIAAAFTNGQQELAISYLRKMQDLNRKPIDKAYLSALNHCCASKKLELLQEILNYISEFAVQVSEEVAIKLTSTVLQLEGDCHNTYIKRSTGDCANCNTKLTSAKLSTDEFEILKQSFYQNVLLGKNIYTKTTAKELERFHTFLSEISDSKFDIVIDGLNVAYSCGARQPASKLANILSCVTNHFLKQGMKVLIFGRTHMSKWPVKQMSFIDKNATLFLTENLSQDDPFLLYAAMMSGSETGVLSRDLMRSHAFRLKKTQNSFRKWLYNVQYRLTHVGFDGTVVVKPPLKFIPESQKNEKNSWHIVQEDNTPSATYPSQVPKLWMCINLPLENR